MIRGIDYEFFGDHDANPTDGDVLLTQTDNPLGEKIDGLVSSANIGEPTVPRLQGGDGSGIEAFITPDRKVAILKRINSVRVISDSGSSEGVVLKDKLSLYVVSEPERVERLADLADAYDNAIHAVGGEVPVRKATIVGALIGYFGVAAYSFFDGVEKEGNNPWLQAVASLGLNPNYLAEDATGACLAGLPILVIAEAVRAGKKVYSKNKPFHIMRKVEKEVDDLVKTGEAVTIPAASNVIGRFSEAVMSMLIKGPDSGDAWHTIKSELKKVETYDRRIGLLRESASGGGEALGPNQEDKYILQLRGQSVIYQMIRFNEGSYAQRRREDV